MSRAPGGFAGADVRSVAILQDYTFATYPYTPGAEMNIKYGRTFMAECGEPPCGFDKPKYNLVSLMATVIVGIIIGTFNCVGLYIPILMRHYELGFVEFCFVVGLAYGIFIKTSALASIMICWFGHRNTALFGMLIFFIGMMLEAFTFHFSVFYLVHLIIYAVGGGLAYGSAMSVSGDLFRKNLTTAMLLVSLGSCLGTIILYWIGIFLLNKISFRLTQICISILVLVFAGATHLFPSFIVDKDCGMLTAKAIVENDDALPMDCEIRHCVTAAARRNNAKHNRSDRSCMCVCVFDIALWSDWSFVLWALCVLCATMALYLPYVFILAFAETVRIELSPWYITVLSIGSGIGRIGILTGVDFTFGYKRAMFVGSVVISGILWILVTWAETFGWLCIWCGLMGLVEGLIVGCIPRLTLVTVPRQWIESSWGWIICFHALGVFMITGFVAVLARETMDFFIGFTIVGIIQIVGGLMGMLLPNEEDPDSPGFEDCLPGEGENMDDVAEDDKVAPPGEPPPPRAAKSILY